ncbi:ATP-binding protein [Pseudomonas proteolytica]|uniref:AAA family ATPase n=1 Tax=Pseudomonas proteolytica TaxID=219574 RepID=UPI0023DFE5A3|nr:ATP-binding protein [Pseudomonas proteolytica]MDF3161230.1 ATP-binding protein [Pseudomonas proteolytica]
MSIAGIRSNRGDIYQTLVAFDWALTVLSDENFQWLEIDSISYSVDDVVVGKADGTIIACQCKKNQTDFKSWSISDLADELEKASRLMQDNSSVNVRFYSRSNFGALAKLREHSSTQNNEASYLASLGQEHQTVEKNLSALLFKFSPRLSSYQFLCRTNFVTSEDLDRMEGLLRERLRNLVSNTDSAFAALWSSLDQLGARIGGDSASAASQHRLTKSDLKAILQKAGATLVPPMNLAEVRLSFSSTSSIGRSWRRDIAGHHIPNPILDELLVCIDEKNKSILLTGLPGSGKTCVMLALQEALEKRAKSNSDIVPLFIQSREFADVATSEDRLAQGLPEKWVEKAARLAENVQVVVVIDSLDVLSIARDHRVLQYFLAQIDRLLLIPNITVVTACRDFDRQYDWRIAERQWDCELKCQPVDWEAEIAPLLSTLGVATANIDGVTRALIRNPRELALFVELAQRGGSFNIVTSQALAQRYLDMIVRADHALGDAAIQAIETTASEMLRLRSLAVPHQRFSASQDIQRKLCSLNVLRETQDGKLTFGHQTLLDVLVISGAVRAGVTLNSFIHSLPPVPFVRPSIRSFVAQLALGERREFRKQLRSVLTGGAAFHIRRLVAESFAEQMPQEEDWPLLRDLREKHRDIFQVFYALASAIEWHHFWLKHLVPALKSAQDSEGLMGHAYRIAQWSNEDCAGVLSFWTDSLSLKWLDRNTFADQLGIHLSQIKSENMALVAPLLERLVDMPLTEQYCLGPVIGKCVEAGVVEDSLLWRYIAGEINDEDLHQYRIDNKLRCQKHEFGGRDEEFIRKRMVQSTTLLDLAIESIEHWSSVRALRYHSTRVGYRNGFLNETSYEHSHSERDIAHASSLKVLLGAVEEAILHQAKSNTDWWQNNRLRLCFNHEGALLYFAILACTGSPVANIEIIARMLCDKKMLEFKLSYELGSLIHSAFIFLSVPLQDAVMAKVLTIWNEEVAAESAVWVLRAQAELILAIPCYLRSPEVQAVVDSYEEKAGLLVRQPEVHSAGGFVSAPFSYEIFLGASDSGVLRLLAHYNGYSRWHRADVLTGGEREVGWQLREAASRNPSRFLNLLSIQWLEIPECFREDIMDGVSTYLAYSYGSLRPNEAWQSVEEPQVSLLVCQVFDELERHPSEWQHQRSSAKAIEACSNFIQNTHEASRLISLAEGFVGLHEADPIEGDDVNLIEIGINMAKGDVADALMILANNFLERGVEFPELLGPMLRRFASDEHPAIRALILRKLPYLQGADFDLGWDLFNLAIQDFYGLWQVAEPCLYYSYHNNFDVVKPLLARLRNKGEGKDLETWGRISALASMTQHINISEFLEDLNILSNTDAWRGAATVWTNHENIRQHREQCLAGIKSGLNTGTPHAIDIALQMGHIFDDEPDAISIPIELIDRCISVFENDQDGENRHHRLFGFHEWLNSTVQNDPEQALAAIERYLTYVLHGKRHIYDHKNSLTQLMTRLFAEAEEREESDCGAMLQRVVGVQDTLLSLGVNGVADWLKAAERP